MEEALTQACADHCGAPSCSGCCCVVERRLSRQWSVLSSCLRCSRGRLSRTGWCGSWTAKWAQRAGSQHTSSSSIAATPHPQSSTHLGHCDGSTGDLEKEFVQVRRQPGVLEQGKVGQRQGQPQLPFFPISGKIDSGQSCSMHSVTSQHSCTARPFSCQCNTRRLLACW